MITLKDKPALLLVDIQKGFEDIAYWGGHRNNPQAETNAQKLLIYWRENNLPVFHAKHNSTETHSPLRPGVVGNNILEMVKPLAEEPIFEKSVNSAFIGTNLEKSLEAQGIQKLVIVGLTTDHCVSTTTRMAANLGFETYIIADATATFDKIGAKGESYSAELLHDTALASLHQEFATQLDTEELLRLLDKSK